MMEGSEAPSSLSQPEPAAVAGRNFALVAEADQNFALVVVA